MKPQPQQITVDWTRAKGLLADLKSHVRRSLAAQILIGKELESLKKKLGFSRGGDRRGSNPHCVGLIESPGTWEGLCKSELGVSDQTAARWIRCFEAAVERAKRHKKEHPEALRLLQMPSAEMDGGEVESLAACVDRLVDGDTQTGLLEELGIVKPSMKGKGGDTSDPNGEKDPRPIDVIALTTFSEITRDLGEIRKAIFRKRHGVDYRILLNNLPLESDKAGEVTLFAIKEELEGIIHGDLAEVIKDVDEAINAKMHGTAPKKQRRKTASLTSR